MREQGVRGLAVRCLNHACLHRNVISADNYPGEVEVPSFGLRMKCSKCGGPPRGRQTELERAGRAYRLAWPTDLGKVMYIPR